MTNNCTTNIVRHINDVAPGTVPYSFQVLLPSYSDLLAYQLALIKIDGSFARTKQEARINEVAYIYRESADFSAEIRAHGSPALARRPPPEDKGKLRDISLTR